MRNLSANLAQFAKAQSEVSTGKRFTRASEDPVAGAQVMRTDRELRAVVQHRRTITSVRARLDAEEASTSQLGDLLSRARELGTSEANGSATAETRAIAAAEVERLLEQAIQLGNTKVGDTHIFGGHQTGAPPFQADGSYVGDDGARRAEISEGYVVETNHTGRQVFVDSDVIGSLSRLRDALRADDAAAITTATGATKEAFDDVQLHLAETGARYRQLDVAGENLDAMASSLELRKEMDQGISFEEATLKMLNVQNTLEAAFASTNRLLNLSLTDYLR